LSQVSLTADQALHRGLHTHKTDIRKKKKAIQKEKGKRDTKNCNNSVNQIPFPNVEEEKGVKEKEIDKKKEGGGGRGLKGWRRYLIH